MIKYTSRIYIFIFLKIKNKYFIYIYIFLQALDEDSQEFGRVAYEFSDKNNPQNEYFDIDSESGIVTNTRTLNDIDPENLPIKLIIVAKDNPSGPLSSRKMSMASLFVSYF